MKIKGLLFPVLIMPLITNCLTSALYSQKDIGSHYLNINKEFTQNFNYSVREKKQENGRTVLQFEKVLEGENRILNAEILNSSSLKAWESAETFTDDRNKFLYAEYIIKNIPLTQKADDEGMTVWQDYTGSEGREIKKGDSIKISLSKASQEKLKDSRLDVYYLEKSNVDSEGIIYVHKYSFSRIGKSDSYRLDEHLEYKGNADIKRVERSYGAYAGLQTLRYVLFPVTVVLDIVSSPYQIYWFFTK